MAAAAVYLAGWLAVSSYKVQQSSRGCSSQLIIILHCGKSGGFSLPTSAVIMELKPRAIGFHWIFRQLISLNLAKSSVRHPFALLERHGKLMLLLLFVLFKGGKMFGSLRTLVISFHSSHTHTHSLCVACHCLCGTEMKSQQANLTQTANLIILIRFRIEFWKLAQSLR